MESIDIKNILKTDKNLVKLWIARDQEYIDEDNIEHRGKLHIFYDTPILLSDRGSKYWGASRVISEIPNYMFPSIKEETCCEVTNIVELINDK